MNCSGDMRNDQTQSSRISMVVWVRVRVGLFVHEEKELRKDLNDSKMASFGHSQTKVQLK